VTLVSDPVLCRAVVKALGWEGTVTGPHTILDRQVVVCASLIPEIHTQRQQEGWPPVTDRDTVTMWGWPGMARYAPRSAVRISGVVVTAGQWRTGLIGAWPFRGVCPAVVLLPLDRVRDDGVREVPDRVGASVVGAVGDMVVVEHLGRFRVAACGWSRLVHEVVYAALCETVGG
jgi:hypothetical protein